MTLPATFDEAKHKLVVADALNYARREIARYGSSGSSPWSDDPLLMPEASRAFMRDFLRRVALEHPIHRMALIDWARAGDPVVHEVLAMLILEIKSRSEPLPTELFGYDMEITRDSILSQHRKKAPARKKMANLLRDICIARVVAGVCDRYGLDPTGNSSRRRSACSIVAEALAVANMKMDGETVVTIWKKMRGAMPTVPGWASTSPE
jgi:hypothetical protein